VLYFCLEIQNISRDLEKSLNSSRIDSKRMEVLEQREVGVNEMGEGTEDDKLRIPREYSRYKSDSF
jgi:hypothetical protein